VVFGFLADARATGSLFRENLTEWTNVTIAASMVKTILGDMSTVARAPRLHSFWSSRLAQSEAPA